MSERWIVTIAAMLSFPLMGGGSLCMMHVDEKLRARGCLVFACGAGIQMTANMLTGHPQWVAVSAGTIALCLCDWWNNGGGDGLKRRMKSWAGSFGRRTAPQGI